MTFVPKSLMNPQTRTQLQKHIAQVSYDRKRKGGSERKGASHQSCLTADPMDCSLTSLWVQGIFLGRVLEWVAIKHLHLGPIRVKRQVEVWRKAEVNSSSRARPGLLCSGKPRSNGLGQLHGEERRSKGPKLQASPPE